ncbi:hypothetical protein BYT27DRAFT_7213749 [Phlegmacium glaucopus]|nr:hypothetical protein BYT27DRAFT_7213749 [Phlegmacium glaucopus]
MEILAFSKMAVARIRRLRNLIKKPMESRVLPISSNAFGNPNRPGRRRKTSPYSEPNMPTTLAGEKSMIMMDMNIEDSKQFLLRWGIETHGISPIPTEKGIDKFNFNSLAFGTGSSGPAFFSLAIRDSLLVIFVVDVIHNPPPWRIRRSRSINVELSLEARESKALPIVVQRCHRLPILPPLGIRSRFY